jgi:hypothetical protein
MCNGSILDKVRHFILHAGYTWQVDVYEGLLDGIVLAEIELTHVDQKLILPDWIGSEVTGDPGYRKINLVAARLAKTTLDPIADEELPVSTENIGTGFHADEPTRTPPSRSQDAFQARGG